MSNENAEAQIDGVEEKLRAAISEAASAVASLAEDAPDPTNTNAEEVVSFANTASAWTNTAVGLIAGLERFRLAHDKVVGPLRGAAGMTTPEEPGAPQHSADSLRSLLVSIGEAAQRGASPTQIERMVAEAGIL